jgi:hypothetical protein
MDTSTVVIAILLMTFLKWLGRGLFIGLIVFAIKKVKEETTKGIQEKMNSLKSHAKTMKNAEGEK